MKPILTVLIGWISMIGSDFLIHGGILAGLYTQDSPFILPAEDAFRRIPLGYFSFLLLAILLRYLFVKMEIHSRKEAAKIGLMVGALIWASFALGLYSISTASPMLLFGWFVGQTVEMGIAGYFMGACLEGVERRKVFIWILLFFLAMVILTIILQLTGIAPPMEMK